MRHSFRSVSCELSLYNSEGGTTASTLVVVSVVFASAEVSDGVLKLNVSPCASKRERLLE